MKKQIEINETEINTLAAWQERFGVQLDDKVHSLDEDLLVDFIEFKSYLNKFGYAFLDNDARDLLAELLSTDNTRN